MSAPFLDDIFAAVSCERIREQIRALEGVRHPQAAPAALKRTEQQIRNTFESLGYPVAIHEFEEDGVSFHNLIATLAGSDLEAGRLIVLAHYDTVSTTPGADDNASAVAGLIELATILRPASFRRTIQFVAVNLEERKSEDDRTSPILRGSTALARQAREDKWDVAGVIDLECIGYAGDTFPQAGPPGLPVKLPETGNFIAVIGNAASAGLVQAYIAAISANRLPLPCVPLLVPGNGEMLPDVRRSDHAAFWDQGYPAIMLTDTANFRNPHYHMPTDTLETLNLPFLAEVCRSVVGLIAALAA